MKNNVSDWRAEIHDFLFELEMFGDDNMYKFPKVPSYTNLKSKKFVYNLALCPFLIEILCSKNSFSQLTKSEFGVSFVDLFGTDINYRNYRRIVGIGEDEQITEEIYKYCCPFFIQDIMECRWVDRKKCFGVHPEKLTISLSVDERCEYQVRDFMRVYGYDLNNTTKSSFLGKVCQTYQFSNIPTYIKNYKVVDEPSLNGTVFIGSKDGFKESYKIHFNTKEDLKKYSLLNEYEIENKTYVTNCVYHYPDETVFYASEIIQDV